MAAAGALMAISLAPFSCANVENHPPPDTGVLQVVMKEKESVPLAQKYTGADSCRPCHGGIYRFWLGTGHAASLESLSRQGRDGEVSCLRCHVTGFGEESGYKDRVSSPGLSSVSCESCHGPALDHVRSDNPGRDIPSLNSDCPPCDINRSCRLCHTGRWSSGFRLAPMLEKISCRQGKRIPAEDGH